MRDHEYDIWYEKVEDNDINTAELQPGPPHVCKLLKSYDGKKPVEPKNDNFFAKTYTFDVIMCDKFFDLLVADGQIIVHKGLNTPPLEQRKKRWFLKFLNFQGHKTSYYVTFKDWCKERWMRES